jgi:hypothetical protein
MRLGVERATVATPEAACVVHGGARSWECRGAFCFSTRPAEPDARAILAADTSIAATAMCVPPSTELLYYRQKLVG